MALVALVGGCKPKEGASCRNDGRELCTSESEALACHDGVWVSMRCRGKAGCDKNGENGVCDQSVAEAGEVCNLDSDFVCSADKKTMLACTKLRWTPAQTCLGERGCVVEPGRVSCDNTIAAVNDPCRDEDDHACTADKSTALVCRGGKFQAAAICRGPKGCRVVPSKETVAGDPSQHRLQVTCDDSVASINDACEPEGHYACALGERSILRCRDRRFVQDDPCKPKEKCQVKGDQVGCY